MALPLFILSNEEKTETDYRAVHFFLKIVYANILPVFRSATHTHSGICQF